MAYASTDRKITSSNTNNNERNQSNSLRNIRINPKSLDDNKKFAEEIPKEFKYNNWSGKLRFWNKASRDRWSWDKIPEDAEKLDAKFDCRNHQSKVITPAADKASEKLKSDSIDYLDKNRSRMKENDTYTDSDTEDDVIISKRTLLATKMINKIVKSVEDGGLLNTLDDNGEEIKEGAKNVTLLQSTNFEKLEDASFLEKLGHFGRSTFFMKFKDCRKEKLFEHEPRAEDCRQMAIADCWLQTILIDILNKKGSKPIKEMLKDDGSSGNVKVRLYKPSSKYSNGTRNYYLDYVPRIYTVPKQIPVLRLFNTDIYNSGAKWVHYVQAAVAKSGIRDKYFGKDYTKKDEAGNKYRDYSSIEGGHADFGWPMILGNNIEFANICNQYNIKDNPDFVKTFRDLVFTSFLNCIEENGERRYLLDRSKINDTNNNMYAKKLTNFSKKFINNVLDIIAPGDFITDKDIDFKILEEKIKKAYIDAMKKEYKLGNCSVSQFVESFSGNFGDFISFDFLDKTSTKYLLKDRGEINKSKGMNEIMQLGVNEEIVNNVLDIIAPQNAIECKVVNDANVFNEKLKEAYIYTLIKKAVDNKKLIYISLEDLGKSDGTGISGGEKMSKGLVENHAYSVCDYGESEGTRYVNVINPWSTRTGRDEKSGKEKSFKGIGNESFKLDISIIAKHWSSFNIEE